MVVKTVKGRTVHMTDSNKKSLFEDTGAEWVRDPRLDDVDKRLIGFSNPETEDGLKLTMPEMRRVCDGTHAMNTPINIPEMRRYSNRLHKSLREVIYKWPDQKLREILIEAEEGRKHPGLLMERYAQAQVDRDKKEEDLKEATERPTEAREDQKRGKNTRTPRKQEGSLSVALEGASVLLTPKQLEFMERLSECPGWKESGVNGEYVASEYASELSDTMNSMSVGAVVTTLREKGILKTEKRRIGAIKCSVFTLSPLGKEVYKTLSAR